jgi:hypothetical protein
VQSSSNSPEIRHFGLAAQTPVYVALVRRSEGTAAHHMFRDAPPDNLMLQSVVHRSSSI